MPPKERSSKPAKGNLPSSSTVRSAKAVLSGKSKKGWFARILPFLGPAFIASVAYVDPGNFAANIQGGARFGYELLWVILGSNLMAMLLQSLSAKLGIATGKNLAEHCAASSLPGSSGRCGSSRNWSPWRPTWPSSSARRSA